MKLSTFLHNISPFKNGTSIKAKLAVAFGKYLLLTNTGTCGALMCVGDLAQQEIEYQRHMLVKRYDWTRMRQMTLVGFGYGPIHHYFYMGIAKLWPKQTLKTVGKKLLADQLILSPVGIAFLFYAAGLLEGNTLRSCTEEFTSKFLEVYTVECSVWPPVQFINFYFMPVKYQVIYINSIAMLYSVFLSYIKHRESAQRNLAVYEKEEKIKAN